MKFITNLLKDKMIFYLAFVLAIVIVIYKLFNYKEGITQDNTSNCNMKKKTDCLSNAGYCEWNSKLYQCTNKHRCNDINNKTSCNTQKYCAWNNSMNTCNIK